MSTVPKAPPESELSQMRAFQADGRHEAALTIAFRLIPDFPQNRDILLGAATSLRHLARITEALAILDRLEQFHPGFSLMHQERGLCYVASKDAPRAVEALLRAVNINPALPMSWRMLEGVYRITGDTENAAMAGANVATLKQLPSDVVSATSLFSDGELDIAEAVIRAYLLGQGDHPEAMRLLAKIGMARDVLDDAELLLEAVLTLAPSHRAARHDYALTLARRHKYREARDQIGQLLALDSDDLAYRELAATIAVGLGEHDTAIELYRGLLNDIPDSSDINLWHGHALKTVGRIPEAIHAYRQAANLRADFGDAYWSLANLKTYRFLDTEVDAMREQEAASDTALDDRIHLCFALGKALEDRGDIHQSWRYYSQGNALKRRESRYRPEIIETNTRKQIEVCTRDFFHSRLGWGVDCCDPIFILGLPRSGSTLIEQILASHSMVEGTQELADIPRIVVDLQGRDPDLDNPRYPAALADMAREDFARLGKTYLTDTQVHRTEKPRFIDKMPNNFRHIGLIHLMLPNACIIDVRREPMACCFGNFKQLFAQGQEFTYGIEDIARYYRTYLELMRHWNKTLPGRILRVHHEDLIDCLEGSVRRILDHCALPFESACVNFHETSRSVRTPSSEQVRQPIFRDGLNQWKKYEGELAALGATLGDALTRYRE